jgi:hypothetical protein
MLRAVNANHPKIKLKAAITVQLAERYHEAKRRTEWSERPNGIEVGNEGASGNILPGLLRCVGRAADRVLAELAGARYGCGQESEGEANRFAANRSRDRRSSMN